MSSPGTQSEKETQKREVLRPKSLIVEKFINLLIVVRMYLKEVPLWSWAALLVLLYAVKLKRQGNIPSSILLIVAMLCSVLGEYLQIEVVYLMAPLIAGVSHFISFKTYWLPAPRSLVGMREDTIQNDTYLMELYPVKKNENARKRIIPWNHRLQMKKVLDYEESKGPIYRVFMKFFTSSLTKVKLILVQGDQEPSNQAFIFSHGRGATPILCSQILTKVVSLGSQKFGVFAVQHTEKNQTGEVEEQKIKRYREIQIQARAAQMASAVEHCKKERIIMMGHSHGGATTVQTYHCLGEEEKKKVSHLILLDPWLYPLTDSKLRQQIQCPVLILANEYFLQNEDVYNRNMEFVRGQKRVIYLVWGKGDHLHQTDMCFLVGNIVGKVKHSELSLEMLNKNLKAIEMFVEGKKVSEEKMREAFKEDVLGVGWKPQRWSNYLSL